MEVSAEDLQQLQRALSGKLVMPGTAEYEQKRGLWNARADKHPAVIISVANRADVVAAVKFARANGMSLSMRGGGHNYAGTGMVEGGISLDFSNMKAVVVDAATKRARVQPGATWADFNGETAKYGLHAPGGQISSVGVPGFTLGGGIGWTARKYGLAADNLVSAEVVLADGRVVNASANENADLFWALRGAGANFGIVTSFEFKLHEMENVLAGMLMYPRAAAADLIKYYRDFSKDAPDELALMAGLMSVPNVGPVAGIMLCYAGDATEGEKAIKPLMNFGQPIMQQVAPLPYLTFSHMFDHAGDHGLRHYNRHGYINQLPNECISSIIECSNAAPSPMSQTHLILLGGAMARVAPEATAYPHRQNKMMLEFIASWAEPTATAAAMNQAWADEAIDSVKSITTGGLYVNFIPEAGPASVEATKAAYGYNYPILSDLKQKYDPTNFFHINQNILPASEFLVAGTF